MASQYTIYILHIIGKEKEKKINKLSKGVSPSFSISKAWRFDCLFPVKYFMGWSMGEKPRAGTCIVWHYTGNTHARAHTRCNIKCT